MQDLISRQAAMDALNEYFDRIGKLKRRGLTKGEKAISLDTVGTIKTLPSAEPQIIQCKDCKYAEYIDDVKTLWCTECGQGRTVAPYDFCSYAERRTNG